MIIVVVDMWDQHWCKTFNRRLGEFVPRLNEGLAQARALEYPVMFMPASVTSFYADSSQYQAALALPHHPMPRQAHFYPLMLPNPNPWPRCECTWSVCTYDPVWTRMHPDVVIEEQDFISESPQALYNLLRDRQAHRLLYTGISANLCVLSREFGVVNMIRHGVACQVASDMVLAWSPGPDFDLGPVLQHISMSIAPVTSFAEAIQ